MENKFNWGCKKTWFQSSKNTLWYLLGCAIGDFGTIIYFQLSDYNISTLTVMILAIINGLITSVILETIILSTQLKNIYMAFRTAIGMSFLSMIVMEVTMNTVDCIIVGEAKIVWWVVPIMLLSGFLAPLPYNYWRLKKYQISCH